MNNKDTRCPDISSDPTFLFVWEDIFNFPGITGILHVLQLGRSGKHGCDHRETDCSVSSSRTNEEY